MKTLILRPEVSAALGEWNERQVGRGVSNQGRVTDPEVLERLVNLAFPGEDLNDTILRLLNQGGASVN